MSYRRWLVVGFKTTIPYSAALISTFRRAISPLSFESILDQALLSALLKPLSYERISAGERRRVYLPMPAVSREERRKFLKQAQ
jgi:hypothetical protein